MANNQPLDNLQRLEKIIAEEIELYLKEAVDNPVNELSEIYPTDNIIKSAAKSAGSVFISFARGRRARYGKGVKHF